MRFDMPPPDAQHTLLCTHEASCNTIQVQQQIGTCSLVRPPRHSKHASSCKHEGSMRGLAHTKLHEGLQLSKCIFMRLPTRLSMHPPADMYGMSQELQVR